MYGPSSSTLQLQKSLQRVSQSLKEMLNHAWELEMELPTTYHIQTLIDMVDY